MQNITCHINGNSPTKLFVSGEADAAKQEVYRLFSHGVISGMPEELEDPYEEKPLVGIVNLVCNTHPKRFESGLRTLADIALAREMDRPNLMTGKREVPAWKALVEEKVPEIRALFPVKTAKKVEEEETEGEE